MSNFLVKLKLIFYFFYPGLCGNVEPRCTHTSPLNVRVVEDVRLYTMLVLWPNFQGVTITNVLWLSNTIGVSFELMSSSISVGHRHSPQLIQGLVVHYTMIHPYSSLQIVILNCVVGEITKLLLMINLILEQSKRSYTMARRRHCS